MNNSVFTNNYHENPWTLRCRCSVAPIELQSHIVSCYMTNFYYRVCITLHKKKGVVKQIIHKDKRARVPPSPSCSTDSVAGTPLISCKTERFNASVNSSSAHHLPGNSGAFSHTFHPRIRALAFHPITPGHLTISLLSHHNIVVSFNDHFIGEYGTFLLEYV